MSAAPALPILWPVARTEEAYDAVLAPILAALDSFNETVQSDASPQPTAQTHFLLSKVYGTLTVGDWLRDRLSEGTSRAEYDGHVVHLDLDRQARFTVYVLTDSFLFQAASVREALLQVVNAAFGLGHPVD